MNKERVLSIANGLFSDFTSVSDNVYRGNYKVKSEQPAGVYFLDLNNKFPDDFSDYQEKLLAAEYYQKPGNLQWNYYLLFIQDKKNESQRKKIESDEKFARKFVFDDAEFEDYFNIMPSSASGSLDLTSKLMEKLDQAGLYDCYSTETYAGSIEKFRANISRKPLKRSGGVSVLNPSEIDFIDKLRLNKDYREYPNEIREFNFGKVNLFHGINGVGKTSLFEAIELMICGKTGRNGAPKEPPSSIDAWYNGSDNVQKFDPKNNAMFLKRDEEWYSKTHARDSHLHDSFNRFNFYNSDAAFKFSNASNDVDVTDALKSIVFGAEYNRILERVAKLFPDFRKEFNKLEAEMKLARQNVMEAERKINALSQLDRAPTFEKTVTNNYRSLNFKNSSLVTKNDHPEMERLCNELTVLLDQIDLLTNSNTIDPVEIKRLLTSNKAKAVWAVTAKNEQSEVQLKIRQIEEQVSQVRKKVAVLNTSIKYFSDPRLFDLLGIETRFNEIEDQLRKSKLIVQTVGDLDLWTFVSEETPQTLIDQNQKKLVELKTEFQIVNKQIEDIIAQYQGVERIIKEIKLLGTQYLEVQEVIYNCPLCQTQFQKEDLKKRIEQADRKDEGGLISLHESQSKITSELALVTKQVENQQKIVSAFRIISPNLIDQPSLSAITKEIKNFLDQKNILEQRKREIDEIRSLANSLSLSEENFISSRASLQAFFPNAEMFSKNGEKVYRSLLVENENEIIYLESAIKERQTELYQILEKLVLKLKVESNRFNSINDIEASIQDEIKKLEKIDGCLVRLTNLVKNDGMISLDDLNIQVKSLAKNIESYKSELKNQFELDLAKTEKAKADKYISENTSVHVRFRMAFETLKPIAEGNQDDDLADFFASNMKEVVDIFKSIHAPVEFVDLVYEEKKLKLVTANGNRRALSEVSTGQRSALALCLFISLNRKLKNGPNIIMFDDPVSFVDDLNILSFLDYLRYFVLKEGKQIFFATASKRLGNLFEHKFDFLGETDFKKWQLKRAL